ncbi:hypothetical protein SAMN05443544_0573 [Agromyces cerinus subsp. cerinus]|uniref:Phage Mu protein F like protein n=2 Tax=Agromyces cerinus TaxID=33878 RepID=A0A1N6DQ44_9MICO|nr:hypothetical protein SAMN05443544_0573 [Agromyces cerinus subsp. cerinus]
MFARPRVLAVVQQGRDAAVRRAVPYTPDVLAETGQVARPVGELNPERFTAAAPDGRSMGSLLDESVIATKVAIRDGATVDEALRSGGSHLIRDVLTVLADTRRQVFGADITQRPAIGGYARMLNAPSCSRCVLLAGRWYRWNQGFQRHPRCDCMHIPSAENRAGDFRTDPKAYFDSLSAGEQDRVFTKNGAQAIRDGADMSRVENARLRGLSTETSHRKFGTPYRLTVDDIYRAAGTRDDAIRLLLMEGYIRPSL